MVEAAADGPAPRDATPDGDQPRRQTARYQPLVVVLVSACAGILADRYWPPSLFAWWSLAGLAWAAWLGLWWGKRERLAAMAVLLAVAATAGGWHHFRWYLFPEDDLAQFAHAGQQPACVQAMALAAARSIPAAEPGPLRPLPGGQRVRLDVRPLWIRDGPAWRPVRGRARLLVHGQLPHVRAGDRLRVFAQLSAPRDADNPGEFDYAVFLRAEGLRSQLQAQFPECVSVVARGPACGLTALVDRVRANGNRVLDRHLDHRRAALAAAVLLGARERLEPAQTQAFRETGTVHLLAISGLHVGILAGALMWLARRVPVRSGRAMLAVAGVVVFYMLLADARPPVVRATILVLVICAALAAGRRPLGFNSLAAAGLILLARNPAELFHTGAQLSFLAVAALIWFAPWCMQAGRPDDSLRRLAEQSRAWPARVVRRGGRLLGRLALASGVIWLITLPLVMARFHLLTPCAVLLNTVLWAPMLAALSTGFATLIFGTVAAPLGELFGSGCDGSLWLLQSAVDSVRRWPGSHLWVPGPANWWLAGFYGLLGVWAAWPRLRPPRRWCLGSLAGWVALGFGVSTLDREPAELDCSFLSMGHGCAVVMELPSGQTILYDAGQLGGPHAATEAIAGFLWWRGITHLDAVILSHADVDHYNALPGLLERFSVGVIYVSPVMFEDRGPALGALRAAIRRSDVPLREIHANDRLWGGKGCRIEVLHPPRRGILGGDNANSIVLDVRYLGGRILLCGDLQPPGLEQLLEEDPLDCDVVLAPHHGSLRSNPPGLAQWSTPQWVVISGGRRRNLGRVRAAYRAVGSQVLHTADTGAVAATIDARGTRVRAWLR